MNEVWAFLQTNWHKILVLLLFLAKAWEFFFDYIRPAVQSEPLSITVPKEGCVITIKPLGKSGDDNAD